MKDRPQNWWYWPVFLIAAALGIYMVWMHPEHPISKFLEWLPF